MYGEKVIMTFSGRLLMEVMKRPKTFFWKFPTTEPIFAAGSGKKKTEASKATLRRRFKSFLEQKYRCKAQAAPIPACTQRRKPQLFCAQ